MCFLLSQNGCSISSKNNIYLGKINYNIFAMWQLNRKYRLDAIVFRHTHTHTYIIFKIPRNSFMGTKNVRQFLIYAHLYKNVFKIDKTVTFKLPENVKITKISLIVFLIMITVLSFHYLYPVTNIKFIYTSIIISFQFFNFFFLMQLIIF